MIEPLADLPEGVIGFAVSGKLQKTDYTDTLIPAVDEAAKIGSVRMVLRYDEFDGMAGSAMWEDLKTGVEHLRAWERIALVTDIEWMVHLTHMFGWMTPGELKIFPISGYTDAVAWIAD